MDIARSLGRLQQRKYGKIGVTVAAMEDFDHFLADPEELKEAREEGIRVLDSRGPREMVIDEQGRLTGLITLGVKSIFDADGRFAPSYDTQDEQIHAAEMVVESIGQTSDVSLFGEALAEQLEWNRGRLQADGHRVATGIQQYLESK